ncbi:SRPBCC family protein [Pseudovibrio denitrificans]|uniref:SRPBCC family protein n=1 Tax=Pseudovibrio denitrificans TaxID=258256 RepID=UPI0039BF19ED
MITPVVKMIKVNCTPKKAFEVFTGDFSKWWPTQTHSVTAMSGGELPDVFCEQKEGGKLYEIAKDGTRHDWGTIKLFQPPKALSVLWHINNPESMATCVDVTFEKDSEGTKVVLSHHDWEKLGEIGSTMRESYNNGWVSVFEHHFKDACNASAE